MSRLSRTALFRRRRRSGIRDAKWKAPSHSLTILDFEKLVGPSYLQCSDVENDPEEGTSLQLPDPSEVHSEEASSLSSLESALTTSSDTWPEDSIELSVDKESDSNFNDSGIADMSVADTEPVFPTCEFSDWQQALTECSSESPETNSDLSTLLSADSYMLTDDFVKNSLNNFRSSGKSYALTGEQQQRLIGIIAGCCRDTAIELLQWILPSSLLTSSVDIELTSVLVQISSLDLVLQFLTVIPGISERSLVHLLRFALSDFDADMPCGDSQKLICQLLKTPYSSPYFVKELKMLNFSEVKALLRYIRILLVDSLTCPNREVGLSETADFLAALLDAHSFCLVHEKSIQDDIAQCEMALSALTYITGIADQLETRKRQSKIGSDEFSSSPEDYDVEVLMFS